MTPGRAPVAFRSLRLDTTPDADGTPFVFVVNDVPVPIRGANWIPDDCLPAARHGRARAASASARPSTRTSTCCASGAAASYESRDVLPRLRRGRRAGLAGLPLRLRDVPRRRAAGARGRGRGARQRRPPDAPPEPRALERQQREHLGLRGLGLEGERIGDRTVGLGYYLDLLPTARRRDRPVAAVLAGQPVLGLDPAIHPNDADHGSRTSGTCGTSVDYVAYRE